MSYKFPEWAEDYKIGDKISRYENDKKLPAQRICAIEYYPVPTFWLEEDADHMAAYEVNATFWSKAKDENDMEDLKVGDYVKRKHWNFSYKLTAIVDSIEGKILEFHSIYGSFRVPMISRGLWEVDNNPDTQNEAEDTEDNVTPKVDILERLREANQARQKLWDPDNIITALYRANELGGEVGEALNEVKKLERERLGIKGSRTTVEKLGDELADIIICTDLLAEMYGIDLREAVKRKFNETSDKVGFDVKIED